MQDWRDFIKEVLITEEDPQEHTRLCRDHPIMDKDLMVVHPEGGVMFMTDLIKEIRPLASSSWRFSFYGLGARESSGEVRITLDLNAAIKGRHVLIVEDIIDSGRTLASVIEMLQTRNPASLYICTLLDKVERREVDVPVKYCGFQIPNAYVFGYGLDIDEYWRNLPFIGVVDLDKYETPL